MRPILGRLLRPEGRVEVEAMQTYDGTASTTAAVAPLQPGAMNQPNEPCGLWSRTNNPNSEPLGHIMERFLLVGPSGRIVWQPERWDDCTGQPNPSQDQSPVPVRSFPICELPPVRPWNQRSLGSHVDPAWIRPRSASRSRTASRPDRESSPRGRSPGLPHRGRWPCRRQPSSRR